MVSGLVIFGIILIIIGVSLLYGANDIANVICDREPHCNINYSVPLLLSGLISAGLGVLLLVVSFIWGN